MDSSSSGASSASSGAVTPPSAADNTWKPKIAVSARPRQTRFELTKEQKRASTDLKKPYSEIIKDIQKRTGTKIDVANRDATSIYIITGTDEARESAQKQIYKELGAKVCVVLRFEYWRC